MSLKPFPAGWNLLVTQKSRRAENRREAVREKEDPRSGGQGTGVSIALKGALKVARSGAGQQGGIPAAIPRHKSFLGPAT